MRTIYAWSDITVAQRPSQVDHFGEATRRVVAYPLGLQPMQWE